MEYRDERNEGIACKKNHCHFYDKDKEQHCAGVSKYGPAVEACTSYEPVTSTNSPLGRSSGLTLGYVRCGADEKYKCEYKRQTYQNVYDGLFTESEQARLISRLTLLLAEALPHIECKTKEQDNLITEIGKLAST